jgi:hypothetical protein
MTDLTNQMHCLTCYVTDQTNQMHSLTYYMSNMTDLTKQKNSIGLTNQM